MDKNKQLIAVESTQALARVGVQFGLANKVLEEKDAENKFSFEPEMVFVEGGTFQMGSDDYDVYVDNDCDDENPVHIVKVDSFYIGKYQVTQKQWQEVMRNNPSDFKGDDLPVESISWNDTQDFLKKLNQKTGKNYRLPTEAEWEFAARGGTKSKNFIYSGSNDIDEIAWYVENSGMENHPVGKKQPNELYIYDMTGNVCEWCNDWYDENYYKNSPSSNPRGAILGSTRVFRGGCAYNPSRYCRVSKRYNTSPIYSTETNGFRVAFTPQ